MWRTLAIVLTVPFWGAACGAVVPVPKVDHPFSDGRCPKGTEFVRARDVIGPTPPGFIVVGGDTEVLKNFAMKYRDDFGTAWRGYDAQILVPRDEALGVVVVVFNAHERTRGPNGVIAGALWMEESGPADGRPITLAGQPGRLLEARDGAFIAMAPAGECSMLTLVATTEELLLRGVKVLPSR